MERRMEFSEWQHKKVPTITVSPKVLKAFQTTLQEVLATVDDYTRIVLTGGEYTESLSIQRPVELVGEGTGDVIFSSRGPCIAVTASVECYLHRLTINSRAGIGGNASEPAAVVVNCGMPVITECEVRSVMACGTSKPTVRDCLISGSPNVGIAIRDDAAGEYIGNRVLNHSGFCIDVSSRAAPVLERNEVGRRALSMEGIDVGKAIVRVSGPHASPRFIKNEIIDYTTDADVAPARPKELAFRRAAVVITGLATPHFEGNDIKSGDVTLSVVGANGTLHDNAIAAALSCGIYLGDAAAPTLTSNHVCGARIGVAIGAGTPSLKGNFVTECDTGVRFGRGCDAFLRANIIELNTTGISLVGPCNGHVIENEIRRNLRAGVRATRTDCRTRVENNTLVSNTDHGIIVEDGAAPDILRNGVVGHKRGITVVRAAEPLVKENKVKSAEQHGISCEDHGRGLFIGNTIEHCMLAAVAITGGAHPTFRSNTVSGGAVGFLCFEGGMGTVERNTVQRTQSGIVVRLFADPLIDANTFEECSECGALIEEEGLGTLTQNMFTKNCVGVTCCTGGEPTIRANTFTENMTGVLLALGSRAIVEKNDFAKDTDAIVFEGTDCESVARRNHIVEPKRYGILSRGEGTGLAVRNVVVGAHEGGLASQHQGATVFDDNRVVHAVSCGIESTEGGLGVFKNTAIEGPGCGVLISTNANPLIIDSTIKGAARCGVDCSRGAQGTVRNVTIEASGVGIYANGDRARTVLEECTVTKNPTGGIELSGRAAVTIGRCSFKGHTTGCLVADAGPSVVEDCTFDDSETALRSTNDGGETVIRRCVFKHSSDQHVEFNRNGECHVIDCEFHAGPRGAWFHDRGRGRINKCTFDGLQEGCVVETNAGPTLTDCSMKHCEVGLWARENGGGSVTSCAITANECNVRSDSAATIALVSCELSGATSKASVLIDGGHGRFDGNTIAGSDAGGVVVSGPSEAVFEENTVRSNGTAGVTCGADSAAVFRRNKITQNWPHGVVLLQSSRAQLQGNTITDNVDYGVVCEPAAAGACRENTFCGHAEASVWLQSASETEMSKNTFTSGAIGLLLEQSNASILSNTVRGQAKGFSIVGHCLSWLEDNIIETNRLGVVFELHSGDKSSKDRGSFARLRGCAFSENAEAAVAIFAHSTPVINRCFFKADVVAVALHEWASGEITECRFDACQKAMEFLGTGVTTVVAQNEFTSNDVGVQVKANHDLRLGANRFDRNTRAGLWITDGSRATFVGLEFSDSPLAVLVDGEAAPTIHSASFRRCGVGCHAADTSTPTFELSSFDKCDVGAKLESPAVVRRCTFSTNTTAGVLCEGTSSTPTITRSLFTNNATDSAATQIQSTAAVVTRNGAEPTISQCDLHGNGVAVLAEAGGCGKVEHCLMHDNKITAVRCTDGSPTISHCTFVKNTAADVVIADRGSPTISECFFRGETDVGVVWLTGGSGTLQRSVFRGLATAAVSMTGAAGATVTQNTIGRNKVGIVADDEPSLGATVSDNTVSECDFGIGSRNGGGVVFQRNALCDCETALFVADAGPTTFLQNHVVAPRKAGLHATATRADVRVQNNIFEHGAISGVHIDGATDLLLLEENLMSANRHGILVVAGTPVLRKNQVTLGENGLEIRIGAAPACDQNVVFNCGRYGLVCSSRAAVCTANCFYSTGQDGAVDNDGVEPKAWRNNEVRNQFTTRVAPVAKGRAPKTPHVSQQQLTTESAKLLQDLGAMYYGSDGDVLPLTEHRGCSLIQPGPEAVDSDRSPAAVLSSGVTLPTSRALSQALAQLKEDQARQQEARQRKAARRRSQQISRTVRDSKRSASVSGASPRSGDVSNQPSRPTSAHTTAPPSGATTPRTARSRGGSTCDAGDAAVHFRRTRRDSTGSQPFDPSPGSDVDVEDGKASKASGSRRQSRRSSTAGPKAATRRRSVSKRRGSVGPPSRRASVRRASSSGPQGDTTPRTTTDGAAKTGRKSIDSGTTTPRKSNASTPSHPGTRTPQKPKTGATPHSRRASAVRVTVAPSEGVPGDVLAEPSSTLDFTAFDDGSVAGVVHSAQAEHGESTPPRPHPPEGPASTTPHRPAPPTTSTPQGPTPGRGRSRQNSTAAAAAAAPHHHHQHHHHAAAESTDGTGDKTPPRQKMHTEVFGGDDDDCDFGCVASPNPRKPPGDGHGEGHEGHGTPPHPPTQPIFSGRRSSASVVLPGITDHITPPHSAGTHDREDLDGSSLPSGNRIPVSPPTKPQDSRAHRRSVVQGEVSAVLGAEIGDVVSSRLRRASTTHVPSPASMASRRRSSAAAVAMDSLLDPALGPGAAATGATVSPRKGHASSASAQRRSSVSLVSVGTFSSPQQGARPTATLPALTGVSRRLSDLGGAFTARGVSSGAGGLGGALQHTATSVPGTARDPGHASPPGAPLRRDRSLSLTTTSLTSLPGGGGSASTAGMQPHHAGVAPDAAGSASRWSSAAGSPGRGATTSQGRRRAGTISGPAGDR